MSKGEVKIKLAIPSVGYQRRMFFNRFALQRIDGHALAFFALVDDSGLLRDIYACMLSKQTLKESKESLGKYLGLVGAPKSSATAWSPPASLMATDVATVINMGYTEEAEIVLGTFAVGPAIQQVKISDKEIQIGGVACLRCDLETQRQFLAALYAKEKE
ncbi:MAG: hypothetical protein HOP33_07120 [Verrucomicrobia bacterium]|nr:hypothetical protein [Verrucomicrobiota bacterium]